MHHPTDRIAHTTAFVAQVVEHWLEREYLQQVQDCMYVTYRTVFLTQSTGLQIVYIFFISKCQ